MEVSRFDYALPEELIAAEPLPRGASRMMLVRRDTGTIEHRRFADILSSIDENTTVVLNESRVIPARFFGKKGTGGAVEFLYLGARPDGTCDTLAKSSKPLRPGEIVTLNSGDTVEIFERVGESCRIRTSFPSTAMVDYLERHGDMPLPPYILKRRGEKRSRPEDRETYQTVYAGGGGSVAAPTAGLHFTDGVLEQLRQRTGGHVERVTLHVGIGTFMPVKADTVEAHVMHRESYHITPDTAARLNGDKAAGRRILAVGTTTVRTLETAASGGILAAGDGSSQLFIYPGYEFRFVDAMLTNFHLPRSTLIMMVSAFAGYDLMMRAYREAVAEWYRFFSYGDCMLIL
ncbi:MAG TPA: tRNA preQ1(34) S-adenosylmethionine ribosyltransferase-isomerase QueA [bacterium]|nr:tRNA preQ1(34) S-adenosylmethionine ribosyltransferase-isomerase QueA [bacterium]